VPAEGRVLLSLADRDKQRLPALAARFEELGFALSATEGTATTLHAAGFTEVETVFKVGQGHPDIPHLLHHHPWRPRRGRSGGGAAQGAAVGEGAAG
jgi:carbamoyl-phosphate synthase large subunit